jgi:hypothetical protein
MPPDATAPVPLDVRVAGSHVSCTVLAPLGDLADALGAIAAIAAAAQRRMVLDLRYAGPPTVEALRTLAGLLDRHGDLVELRRGCPTVRAFLRLRGSAGQPEPDDAVARQPSPGLGASLSRSTSTGARSCSVRVGPPWPR